MRVQPIVNRCLRIALIESDDLMRALALRWLAEAGHEIQAVNPCGGEALPGFDLVVANVPSPCSAGEVLCRLRALYAAPVLLVSARLQRGQCCSATLPCQLGVRAVLSKPFTRRELLAAVARALPPADPPAGRR